MIDSTDIERLSTASEELTAMLNEDELRDAGLLVFANKQDQPGAKGAGEISEALQLGELRDRNWSIVACSAIDGSGIAEGMDWLVVSIRLLSSNNWLISYISKPSTQSHDKVYEASMHFDCLELKIIFSTSIFQLYQPKSFEEASVQ